MSSGDHGSSDGGSSDAAQAAEKAVEGVGKLAGGIASALPEDGDAREALEGVEKVADAAGGAIEAARAVSRLADADGASDVAGALGSAGQGAASIVGAAGGSEARDVVSGVSRGVQAVGQAVEVFDSMEEALGGSGAGSSAGSSGSTDRHEVEYHFELASVGGRWGVREVDFHEALNEPFELTVRALLLDAHPESSELLGQECSLSLERGGQQRMFKGIVRKAKVLERHSGLNVRLTIVPALWLLEQRRGSRIFQDLTVPEIVEEVFQRALGGRSRELRNELSETYPRHEYVTQYQESELAFVTRLCEQEGIFFYFDHESGDHEVLVLADGTSGLAEVGEDGRVEFARDPAQAPGGEAVYRANHAERVGTTDMVVADWDWTRPSVVLREEQTGRGEDDPALEDYDHTDAVAIYAYDAGGRAYGEHDAVRQARIRAQRLDLDRQHWHMRSTVLSARPGRILELQGCPDGALDGRRYLIVSTHGSGEATEGVDGGFDNGFDCVPVDVPYRPRRSVPRPLAYGPSSAIVTGPSGEEIHTDEHGRVKVQFHWDREGQRDERSSCWLRVQQTWAGPGWGSWFLPRVGMEVVVQFLDGNPDKPFVAGCLYHGENPTPYPLPDDKTKSTIKTNSSPGGGGFNELRFEDKAGSEEVFIHAQKDFNEVVEHDHSTHVKNDQANTVGVNQTEHVGGEQTMTVDKNRTVHVKGSQSFKIDGGEANAGVTGSKLEITGDYKVDVSDWIKIEAPTYIQIKCGDSVIRMEPGKIRLTAGGGSEIVLDVNAQTTSSQGTEVLLDADARTTASTGAELKLDATADLHSIDGSQVLLDANAAMTSSKGATVQLSADADMSGMGATVTGTQHADVSAPTATLAGAAGSVEAAAGGVDVAGPQVNVTGQGAVNISGSVVKIN